MTEAARAINDDGGIEGALPASRPCWTARHAASRSFGARSARIFASGRRRRRSAWRRSLLAHPTQRRNARRGDRVLGVWPKPSILDRVDGYAPRPCPARLGQSDRGSRAGARAALASIVSRCSPREHGGSGGARRCRRQIASHRARRRSCSPRCARPAPEVRIAALRALGTARRQAHGRGASCCTAGSGRDSTHGSAQRDPTAQPSRGDDRRSCSRRWSVRARSPSSRALSRHSGRFRARRAARQLTRLVDQLTQGKIAPEIQLDVAEAARATKHAPLIARLDSLEKSRAGAAPRVAYADVLHGGDARRGRRVVMEGASAQCTQCHNFGTGPGANVGPPLRDVASRLTREQLLEALVDPSARIAPGFGPVQVTLKNGQSCSARSGRRRTATSWSTRARRRGGS